MGYLIIRWLGILLLLWFVLATARAAVMARRTQEAEGRRYYRTIFLSGLPSSLGLSLLLFVEGPRKWLGVCFLLLGIATRMFAGWQAGDWPWGKTDEH